MQFTKSHLLTGDALRAAYSLAAENKRITDARNALNERYQADVLALEEERGTTAEAAIKTIMGATGMSGDAKAFGLDITHLEQHGLAFLLELGQPATPAAQVASKPPGTVLN